MLSPYLSGLLPVANLSSESLTFQVTIFTKLSFSFQVPEIQVLGTRRRDTFHSASEFLRDHLPLNHPLGYLQPISIDVVLQGFTPRTLQSYWTAWSHFKQFHLKHSLSFPCFDTLTTSSFITYTYISRKIKIITKVYLPDIHLICKMIHGSECLSFSRIKLLIKAIRPPGSLSRFVPP